MNLPQLLNRIHNGVCDMMNSPKRFTSQSVDAQINQKLRIGDKTLRQMTEDGQKVYIVQSAQINIQQNLTEEGTKVLTYVNQLRDQLIDLRDEANLFQSLLYKYNQGVTLKSLLDFVERAYIDISLANSKTQAEAASKIGISRTTLIEKIKRLNRSNTRKELIECETPSSID